MNLAWQRLFIASLLLALPLYAQAQHIPAEIVLGALSPIVVVILAVIVGWLERSWRSGTVNGGVGLAGRSLRVCPPTTRYR